VLIEGNLIKEVSPMLISTKCATVIDGGGRTLMPCLIDAHWHTVYMSSFAESSNPDRRRPANTKPPT